MKRPTVYKGKSRYLIFKVKTKLSKYCIKQMQLVCMHQLPQLEELFLGQWVYTQKDFGSTCWCFSSITILNSTIKGEEPI